MIQGVNPKHISAEAFGIWSLDYLRIWALKSGDWSLGLRIWAVGSGTWDLGAGIWDLGSGIWDLGLGAGWELVTCTPEPGSGN